MKKKSIIVVCTVVVLTIISCVLLESAEYVFIPKQERYIDHLANSSADSTLGLTQIPEDGIVDESFTSHLPLIIIDTGGEEIINYKTYNSDTEAFDEPDGIDPYFDMTLSVIDNESHINTLADTRCIETLGKIKVRGNSSASKYLPKYQYALKLLDENGDNADVSLLDMGAENSWILSPTVRDLSYIRNYLAFNIAGQLEPYQSDVRYCEVLFKNNNQYEYIGLYMLYEPVEVSDNRIDISKDVSKYDLGQGFLVKKDRFDKNEMVLYTWATQENKYSWFENDLKKGSYFSLEYPSDEDASDGVVENIINEISEIEMLLYNDELRDYTLLEQKLDMDSFVDYFLINEFFGNYDAGLYSTFLYKSADGKLTMGPYWDFDAAMDNADLTLAEVNSFVFSQRPWFDCLVKMKEFVDKLDSRYKELRRSILSDEYIDSFVDDTFDYLGNAVLRDRSVYYDYFNKLEIVEEKSSGLNIDRNRYTPIDEIQRIKDFLYEHGSYMDLHISDLTWYVEDDGKTTANNTVAGLGFIVIILIVIVVIQRYRNSL